MGLLQETGGQAFSYLEAEHLIGRSDQCNLRLPARHISSVHATLVWQRGHWELRDRGSRNGTFLNGKRLESQASYRVNRGDRLSFGGYPTQWELTDAGGPEVMAVPLKSGRPRLMRQGLLWFGEEGESICAYRDDTGHLLWEPEGESLMLKNGQVVTVGDRDFRIYIPESASETAELEAARASVRELNLHFEVSMDEEHVSLRALLGRTPYELGARGHNYLLLLLARHRNRAHQANEQPSEQGWVALTKLCADLRVDPERLRTDIYRIRRQFAELPLLDPGNIIQRRADTREIRLGIVHPAVIGIQRD